MKSFIADLKQLASLPTERRYRKLVLAEYPFDPQLLAASALYRASRRLYRELPGTFAPRICSTMRSLSAQDLFADHIDYSPSFSEMLWFKDYHVEVFDEKAIIEALDTFSSISVFHEQNHRILWRLLPPAPAEQDEFRRYLNFAESLIVTLDMALGDQLGAKSSGAFERVKAIYHTGGRDRFHQKSKKEYRQYLHVILTAVYMLLELKEPDDIPAAAAYMFPGQARMVRAALTRAGDLSETFVQNTNPQWQAKNWRASLKKLRKLQAGAAQAWSPIEDPLDFDEEFAIANWVFDSFGL